MTPSLRAIPRPVIIAPAILAVLVVGALWWRSSWIITHLLRSWATARNIFRAEDYFYTGPLFESLWIQLGGN